MFDKTTNSNKKLIPVFEHNALLGNISDVDIQKMSIQDVFK